MARQTPSDVVVVLGLGRFGKSLALELMNQGTEVLGLDASESVVQKLAHRLTHAAVVDTTDEESLRQLSVDEYDRAVVGIGSDLEASLLTASALINLNVPPNIWPKRSATPTPRSSPRSGGSTMWCGPNTTWVKGSPTLSVVA